MERSRRRISFLFADFHLSRFWRKIELLSKPDLSRGAELKAQGFNMGLHPHTKKRDRWLRYGALKGYIDGQIMFEKK